MKSSSKIIFLVGLFTLFLSAQAFALPIAGSQIKMLNDSTVPYTMEDLSDHTFYQTFCLESQNYFTPGATYDVVSVGNDAYGGGGGAVGGFDPVSDDTKWLYAAFMSNVFSRVTDAALKVQKAIWYLEEEVGGSLTYWEELNDFSFEDSGWTVVAVNLTGNYKDAQSQLVGVAPVPEPATMLLFGTGLVGLASLSRKKRK